MNRISFQRWGLASLALLLALWSCLMAAPPARAQEFLDPADAFKMSAQMIDGQTVAVTYEIADGYYMYRERFKFVAAGAQLGAPQFPAGQVHFDENFGKNVETYKRSVTIRMPVRAHGMFTLTVTGQGCAEAGLCYPPQDATVRLIGAPAGAAATGGDSGHGPDRGADSSADSGGGQAASAPGAASGAGAFAASRASPARTASPATPGAPPSVSEPAAASAASGSAATTTGTGSAAQATPAASESDLSRIGQVLLGGRLLAIIPAFLLLGLGLAFTPCVLPMVPILSSIIVGEGAGVQRSRGFLLSLAYSLGMAIVYTALGIAAGLIGEGLSAALQNAWVLGAFALLMVAMALSMFGVYQLQMPAAVQTSLSNASSRQRGGKTAGVFVMGAISALIVGPCVAAPLAGALVYISQTRNVVVGGTALFSMAMGMSIPLLLVGLSAGSLLPKAGMWMESVKRFFGVLMLAMALYLVAPVLPPAVQLAGWAALLIGYGAWLVRGERKWPALAFGVVFIVLGALQVVGVATGARDPLAPLAQVRGGAPHGLAFQRIQNTAQLDAELARLNGKTAMLDFYADWCVSCKEMEKLTFTDTRVQAALANTVLLQIDVTANNADDKAMLKRFGLFGPPGIILFNKAGQEIPGARVVGYQNADKFLASLRRLD